MIEWINIFNRSSTHTHIRLRALPLLVEGSIDGVTFEQIARFEHYHDFGGRSVGPVPLQIEAPNGIAARFLRLTVRNEWTCLHLSEIAVFGFADAPRAAPAQLPIPVWTNVALGGIAAQSSLSDWSRGTAAEEAQRPVLAAPGLDFSFHTAAEHRPWWRIDLCAIHHIREVRLFNRQGHRGLSARLAQFQFQVSDDAVTWLPVYERQDVTALGGVIGGPFVWQPSQEFATRHFRVQLVGHGILHFNKIEIYGEPADIESSPAA